MSSGSGVESSSSNGGGDTKNKETKEEFHTYLEEKIPIPKGAKDER